MKGAKMWAFGQYYKPKNCGDVFKILSRELNFEGNVYDNIEAYIKCKKGQLKILKKEYGSIFIDYIKIDVEEMKKNMK